MDNTHIHPSSRHLAHLVDLHAWQGAPANEDREHEVVILVNHGYVVGYCPQRLQPMWAAYRVAYADRDVDYERPHVYYEDKRLRPLQRLSADTFGKHEGVAYHVGHMAPNEVINRQYGRLAQMETFFMTNMCPQRGSLNNGLWKRLETAIREIEDTKANDHMWVLAGPVFGDTPAFLERKQGHRVPIPEAFFCITIDPHSYPYKRRSNVTMECFLMPQDASSDTEVFDYLVDLEDIEARTRLKFFEGWSREFDPMAGISFGVGDESAGNRERLRESFERLARAEDADA